VVSAGAKVGSLAIGSSTRSTRSACVISVSASSSFGSGTRARRLLIGENPSIPRPKHRLVGAASICRKCTFDSGFLHHTGRFGDWLDGTSG
jgi:hypothetical protein